MRSKMDRGIEGVKIHILWTSLCVASKLAVSVACVNCFILMSYVVQYVMTIFIRRNADNKNRKQTVKGQRIKVNTNK